MADAINPHFTLPFTFRPGDKHADVLEQDSSDDVLNCVATLLRTEKGSRLEVPDYGVVDLTFTEDGDFSAVTEAIDLWEPRADSVLTVNPLDSADKLKALLRVDIPGRTDD